MYDYKDIKTLEQAYAVHPDKINLQETVEKLNSLPARFSRGMIATLNAQVVTEVINNNDPSVAAFKPDYNNRSQEKCAPWCLGGDGSGAGFRFNGDGWAGTYSSADGGARLALRDQARSQHMRENFPDIYKEFFLVLE